MAKKVTISLLSLLLVAGAIVGIYFYNQSDIPQKPVVETQKPEATHELLDVTEDDVSDGGNVSEDVTEDENVTEFVPSDENLSDNTGDVTTTNFEIEYIIDHTTSQQVSPRVVFGSSYNVADNYIKFDSNGSFEMYLSGYFNNTKKGTYKLYDNVISVNYDDGTASEYDVTYTDSGVISYIIVNYGDYDVYFS